MTTHILSLTYAPKIPLVKSGECTQTIRLHNPNRPKKVGDKLILHTWEGKPYRSRWDWRLETEIGDVTRLRFQIGNRCPQLLFAEGTVWMDTDDAELKSIGVADGISKEDELEYILMELNDRIETGLWGTVWDIIRWPKPTIRRIE